MGFGFECGDGWYKLIYDLSKKLEALILEFPEEHREHYYAMQVKEKYGGLDFNMIGTNAMLDLAEAVRPDSLHVCECCGEPGELYVECGWYYTSCEKCNKGGKPVND
jgi:hypothetical protein